MNFITTILNMRLNLNLVGNVVKYIINIITLVGTSIIGPLFPIKRGNRLHKSIFPPTTCTDMVL